jgi:hypothetical protein
MPGYSEPPGRLQPGVGATANRIAVIDDVIARRPALAMTPEQMAQRIAAAGNAARREEHAALAKAGEDKARVMAELRATAGSAWTRADQRNRQLWFCWAGWRSASSHERSCRAWSPARSGELAMARAHGRADARHAPSGSRQRMQSASPSARGGAMHD